MSALHSFAIFGFNSATENGVERLNALLAIKHKDFSFALLAYNWVIEGMKLCIPINLLHKLSGFNFIFCTPEQQSLYWIVTHEAIE